MISTVVAVVAANITRLTDGICVHTKGGAGDDIQTGGPQNPGLENMTHTLRK